jgi:hypothetical protein
MMKPIEQLPHRGTCTKKSDVHTRSEPLVSFLGHLLELAAAKYQPTDTCSSRSTKEHHQPQSQRHSFVIVSDNARIHPKHACLCNIVMRQHTMMDTSMPRRATSCPSNLNALCCLRRTNTTAAAMMRVASTGSLCRWDANTTTKCGFVDKKSDGAARPPLRTWNLDHEDFSDHCDDDDDFGTFVLLGEDEEEDDMSTTRYTPQSSDWKSLSLSSAPTFTAMPLMSN